MLHLEPSMSGHSPNNYNNGIDFSFHRILLTSNIEASYDLYVQVAFLAIPKGDTSTSIIKFYIYFMVFFTFVANDNFQMFVENNWKNLVKNFK